jgi:uncharacterized protein (TIGR03437 family)
MLGNIPVPLVYIPFDTPLNTQYQLTVSREGNISVPQSLVVALAQPGVFTTNQAGTGQGADDLLHGIRGSIARGCVGTTCASYAAVKGSESRDGDDRGTERLGTVFGADAGVGRIVSGECRGAGGGFR